MVVLHNDTSEATFDTSYLNVKRVTGYDCDDEAIEGRELIWDVYPRVEEAGSMLKISFNQPQPAGVELELKIEYSTTEECTALGWLDKEQTASGNMPFVYSQCQAIHARSLLPCQDTPSVKATYDGRVQSKYPVLLSALRIQPAPHEPLLTDEGYDKTYIYDQPTPIPSYLIAIAGGELEFASLGARTGVYAEPSLLEAAKWEFAELESFVAAAEKITGQPYVWRRYDVLVLPASFPYGGMENPTLTFLTPTLLTGDRTEVLTCAHEAAHSWSGNLVTNARWNDFWLNEGWTTYFERLICRELEGEPARAFEYIMGKSSLQSALEQYKDTPQYQRLHINYKRYGDPDDGFSTIPYEKGSTLLFYLEQVAGGFDVWQPYIQAYVKEFKYKSLTTDMWLEHLWAFWNKHNPEVAEKLKREVDFNAWLFGEGTALPVKMQFDTTLADAAYALAEQWNTARDSSKPSFSPADIEGFKSTQVELFLDILEGYEAFTPEMVEELNKQYKLEESNNAEIKVRWYAVALKAGQYAPEAARWVTTVGRMKFARPTYRAINKVDPALAKKTYKEQGRKFLHPIARKVVAKDLGVPY